MELPENKNWRLQPTGLAKHSKTHGITGMGKGLALQQAVGRVFGRFWKQTKPFIWSKPGPLAGYPDPLLTLLRNCKHTPLVGGSRPNWLNRDG